MNSNSTWTTQTFDSPIVADFEQVADRQDRLTGFSTAKLLQSRILMIGAGGLNSAIAGPLVRKGIGQLHICDHDVVEISNLNRQHFYAADLFAPKAFRLAANAAREGQLGSQVVGHDTAFDEASANELAAETDVVVCGVDNNQTRRDAASFSRGCGIPVIFSAVSESADYGWVFVQEPQGACLTCVFPRMADGDSDRQRCRPVPATADILHVLGGIVLYAIDSLLMQRPRGWNFRSVHLVGTSTDVIDVVSSRRDCVLCRENKHCVTEPK